MLFDWFTVGAQAINFLILVGLMKRFLYKPILDAIDARERRVADEMARADAKTAEARTERDAFRDKNEAFDRQRDALLKKAADDAAAERRRLIEDARQAAETQQTQRREAVQRDLKRLNEDIVRRTREEVLAITRRTLTDLAGADLDARMADVFLGRLRSLDDEARKKLDNALSGSSDPVVVRSAFELPESARAAVRQALNEIAAADLTIRFTTAADVIGGIELVANGQKLAWSIADHLTALGQRFDELLEPAS